MKLCFTEGTANSLCPGAECRSFLAPAGLIAGSMTFAARANHVGGLPSHRARGFQELRSGWRSSSSPTLAGEAAGRAVRRPGEIMKSWRLWELLQLQHEPAD